MTSTNTNQKSIPLKQPETLWGKGGKIKMNMKEILKDLRDKENKS